MTVKIVAGIIAVALLLAYVGPLAFKMKDLALTGVIVIGVVVMLVDLWHSLRKSDD